MIEEKGRGNGEVAAPLRGGLRAAVRGLKGTHQSSDFDGTLGRRAQDLFALPPVARAQLVGLERVEDAQRLLRVAADVEAVDRDVLDDIVGIDDEGGAIGDALVAVDGCPSASASSFLLSAIHGKSAAASRSSDLRQAKWTKSVSVEAPIRIGVAVREIALQLAIADDLGRADEGEVLRPVEDDLPLAVGLGRGRSSRRRAERTCPAGRER